MARTITDVSSFSFGGPVLPLAVRVCRALLWLQSAIVAVGGVFVLLTAVMFGAASSIPFHGGELSGGAAAVLGALYTAAGVVLACLAAALGRLARWCLPAIVLTEVLVAGVDGLGAAGLAASTMIRLALSAAVLLLLATPAARRALAHGSAA